MGQVFTTSTGSFAHVNLVPDNYVVQVISVPNYTIVSAEDTTPDLDLAPNTNINDNTIPSTVYPTTIDNGNIFIFTPNPGTISGTVFDNLANPIENAVINIYDDDNLDGIADGALVASGLTNASGVYSITGLQSGKYALGSADKSYIIELEVPLGYTIVSGIDGSIDSDLLADANTSDNIIPCTLTAGEVDANNNFIITL